MNAILSTALAILCGVAVLVLLGTVGVASAFFHLFEVSADEAANVRLAVLIVGVNLALTFPLSVFDAALWAMQRFDILNAIDIPSVLLRAGLTFWLIGSGHGLVTLALITVLTTVVSASAKAVVSFRLDPCLRVSPAHVRREAARGLFGYGIWYFLLSSARLITPQISPLVIGARLGPAWVTPQSVAARLTGYANALLIGGTQVLTPVATRLHAEESHAGQQNLFLEGGKYCTALVLFFAGLLVCLGRPLILLWMGPALESAALLLVILALGELLPMSQWITYSMILGMGRHRELACFCLVESVVAVALALLLVNPYGLLGVCVAVALPGALSRGVCQMVYACRLVRVPLRRYATGAILPALAVAALPVLGLAAMNSWRPPATWVELVAYTAIYGAGYGAMSGAVLFGYRRVRTASELAG